MILFLIYVFIKNWFFFFFRNSNNSVLPSVRYFHYALYLARGRLRRLTSNFSLLSQVNPQDKLGLWPVHTGTLRHLPARFPPNPPFIALTNDEAVKEGACLIGPVAGAIWGCTFFSSKPQKSDFCNFPSKAPVLRPNLLPNPRLTKCVGNTWIGELPLPRAILRVMFHVRDRGIYNLFNGTDGQTSELRVQIALRKKCKLVFFFVFWCGEKGKERVIIKLG
jgi:hypothetical protein